jgi:DNA (cytosine-5)-methyltransferase 1
VPGLLRDEYKPMIEQLREEIRAAGYTVPDELPVVNAVDFGVPQDRSRVMLIGSRKGQPVATVPLPRFQPPETEAKKTAKNGKVDAKPLPCAPSVADAIADLPKIEQYKQLLECDAVRLDARTTALQPSLYVQRLNGADNDDFSYRRNWDPRVMTNCGRTGHSKAAVARFAATAPGKTDRVSRYRRLELDGVCKTLRAGTGKDHGSHTPPRPIHPIEARVITVREGARLHSYPDWFRFHVTKWHAWRQLGNSVPPLLGRAIATQIVRALGVGVTRPRLKLALGSPTLLGYTSDEEGAAPKRARARPRDRMVNVALTAGKKKRPNHLSRPGKRHKAARVRRLLASRSRKNARRTSPPGRAAA